MTPLQFSALLIRYYCVWALVDAAIVLIELPGHVFGIINAPVGYLTSQRELALVVMAVRFLIYAGTGVGFLIYTKPLARFFSKSLDRL